ncbi:MAG: energy transducer TonB [Bacteroidota bacterium]
MVPNYFDNPTVKILLDKSLKKNNRNLYDKLHDNKTYYANGMKEGQHDLVDYLIKEKKIRDHRNQDRGSLYFSIGLFLTFAFLLMAFEWNFVNDQSLVQLSDGSVEMEQIIDIPNTEQPPPPPPQKVIKFAQIVEVPDEEEIQEDFKTDFDLEVTETSEVVDIEYPVFEEEEEKVDEIFLVVEEQPVPAGGFEAFYKHIYENIVYPPVARRAGIQGKVFVQFVIEKNGKLSDVKVVKGIDTLCDQEAVRAVEDAPLAWSPGKQRGKAVRTQMILPITFVLKQI